MLVAYADGCVGGCVSGSANSFTSLATIARQNTGKRLYAASDFTTLNGPPDTPLTDGTRTGNKVTLTWSTPDDHGREITAYRIYRRSETEPYKRLIQLYPTDHSYTDIYVKSGVKYWYYVTAVNYHGESRTCSEVLPTDLTDAPPVNTCTPPGKQAITDPSGDATVSALDVESLSKRGSEQDHQPPPSQPSRGEALTPADYPPARPGLSRKSRSLGCRRRPGSDPLRWPAGRR